MPGLWGDLWSGNSGGSGTGFTTATTKTSDYTASSNEIVPIDSTGGSFIVYLPVSPSHGDAVKLVATDGVLDNPITINRNGKNINGSAQNIVFDWDGELTLFYFEPTGWVLK